MKTRLLIPATLVAMLAVTGLAGCQAASAPGAPATGTANVLPITADPIKNTSTAPGLSIVSALAQDNIDPATGASITDRLQVTLKNSTAAPLTTLEIYYVMKDVTTGRSEAYYQALTGLTLAANSQTTIFFDNQTGAGHYPENKFSIYRSSTNQVDFTIEVSAAGVQVATAKASKAAGVGETGN